MSETETHGSLAGWTLLFQQDRGACGSSSHHAGEFGCLSVFRREGTKRVGLAFSVPVQAVTAGAILQLTAFRLRSLLQRQRILIRFPSPCLLTNFSAEKSDRRQPSITGTEFHYGASLPRRNPDTARTTASSILRLVVRHKESTLRNKTAPIGV